MHTLALTNERVAASPVSFSFPISATVSINTTVTGEARQYATVSIVNGAMSLWTATLTQFNPVAEIPFDVIAGQLTIRKGGTFTLTIPSALQYGNVIAALHIISPVNPDGYDFNAQVATWPLSS